MSIEDLVHLECYIMSSGVQLLPFRRSYLFFRVGQSKIPLQELTHLFVLKSLIHHAEVEDATGENISVMSLILKQFPENYLKKGVYLRCFWNRMVLDLTND